MDFIKHSSIGKNFALPRISYSLNKKNFIKTFYSIKNRFENFEYCIRQGISAAVI